MTAIAPTPQGDVVLTGIIQGTATGLAGPGMPLVQAGDAGTGSDLYVLKIDPSGKATYGLVYGAAGANVQPNVMILIDSSHSMNDQVASIPYDNNLSPGYPVINSCVENGTSNRPCTTVKVYRRTSTNPAT